MTTRAIKQNRPPASIVYRATPFTVFKTLLWAEFAPRRRVLGYIVGLLVLFWLFAESYALDMPLSSRRGSMPFEGLTEKLAIAGVLYSALSHGATGFSHRQSWQAFALPVGLRGLLLPGLVFQFGLSVLMALLWGLHRNVSGIESPFIHPFTLLSVLAVQGQAAMLWCGALGIARGIGMFAMGLTCATVAGITAGGFFLLSPAPVTASVLVFCGWLWSVVAARFMKDYAIGVPDGYGLPDFTSLRKWYLTRAERKAEFRSAFWAQCWFEWKRSVHWLPAIFCVATLITLTIDIPYFLTRGYTFFDDGSGSDRDLWFRPTGYALFIGPLVVWLLNARVSRPYRRFVCTRPASARMIGGAKFVASIAAALAGAFVLQLADQALGFLLSSGTAGNAVSALPLSWHSLAPSLSIALAIYLLLCYGPFLIVPMTACAALELIVFSDAEVRFPTDVSAISLSLFSLTIIILALLPIFVARAFLKPILDLSGYPKPKALTASGIAIAFFIVLAGVERSTTATTIGQYAFVYLGPVLLAISTMSYGWRTGLITKPVLCAVSALYVTLLYLGAVSDIESTPFIWLIDGTFVGYGIVLCLTPVMLYPLILNSQRCEPLREQDGVTPHWLLFFAPLAWLALYIVGESNDYRERRR